MAHLTIVTQRSSMTQWPIQRNVFTLTMNKSSQFDTTHILTTHNSNAPRLISTTPHQHHHVSQPSTFNTFDDSLTNLSWLHDINILKRTIPPINSFNQINNKRKETSLSPPTVSTTNEDLTVTTEFDDEQDERWRLYKNNPHVKPAYSYAQLILLAMKQSGFEKMTLQMIYDWVAENFPYFKKMEPTWQNSIRHNLSLNKCFMKVARTKKEVGSGKGGFWKLSPDYVRQSSTSSSSSSSSTSNTNSTTSTKRFRSSKRSSTNSSSTNELRSDNVTSTTKISSRISHENIKNESWIDPILPCLVSKVSSPFQCSPMNPSDRTSSFRLPTSFLSPTSSPSNFPIISPFQPQPFADLSAILSPSPSSSPSSMSSNMSKTKFDESDMLLLDSSTFDWDAYLCETPTDLDVQPLLTMKSEHDLFNDFNAALTDLTSTANGTTEFDTFDYSTRNSLFDDEEHSNPFEQFSIKTSSTKRSMINESSSMTTTKLPSLQAAFDLKLPKCE